MSSSAADSMASVCSPYGWARRPMPRECAQSRRARTWWRLNRSETVAQKSCRICRVAWASKAKTWLLLSRTRAGRYGSSGRPVRSSKARGSSGVQVSPSVSISMESSKNAPPAAFSRPRREPVSTARSQKPVTAAVPAALKWSTT